MPTSIETRRETGKWTPEPWAKQERRESLKAIIAPTLWLWAVSMGICLPVFYFVSWWDKGSPVPLW